LRSARFRRVSLIGDNAALAERADELVAVAIEQGFPHWRAQGTIYRGWAKIKNGEVAEGTALLRTGSAAYRAAGSELFVPHYMDLQAAASAIADAARCGHRGSTPRRGA
jgi:predicted ATPase